MAELHVVTALVEKYRELSGKLKACEKEADKLKVQLSHVDAAIRIFREEFDTGAILPKRLYRRNPHFKKGVFIRSAMDVLREAPEPLSARELARLTLQRQGISEPDNDAIEALRRALNGCLMKRAKDGSVAMHEDTYPKRWELVR